MNVVGPIAAGLVLGVLLTTVGACTTSPDGTGISPAGPLMKYALAPGESIRFEARVVERIEAGSYVYLGVERPSGDRAWVVTLSSSSGARPGVDKVRVVAMGYAEHFASKRLARTFDGLYFAVVRPA